jgi:hypothetical protein
VGDKIGGGIYKVNLRVVLYHLLYWASQCFNDVFKLPRVKANASALVCYLV